VLLELTRALLADNVGVTIFGNDRAMCVLALSPSLSLSCRPTLGLD